jgi:alpha-1,6-mannosyltransferase
VLTFRLLTLAATIELFLLSLWAVAPLAPISQTISPLARQWPWLLGPARLIFGSAPVNGSIPPERGWPALLLFATLLVGASCQAALAIPLCLRYAGGGRRYLLLALGAAAIFSLTLVLLPALPSDDLFSYILYGRIGAIHHANPLIVTPSAFPNDPFLRLVFWQGTRSVYGPVWLLISQGLTLLADALGGSLAGYVLLYKMLGLIAHLVNALLIWLIVGRLAPHRQLVATLFYAWNPLCLLEFSASAHNDAVMLTFLLLGVYCLLRGWEVTALIAFGLSISVKYVMLALLPLYFAVIVRQTLEQGGTKPRAVLRVGWRVLVVAGVIALTLLPYWAGPQTLGAVIYSPPAQHLDNSLLDAMSWPLRAAVEALGAPQGAAATVSRSSLKVAGIVVFSGIWLLELFRVRSLKTLLYAWVVVILGYLLIASGWYWPWYATWAVALAALVVGFGLDADDIPSPTEPEATSTAARTVMVATLLLAGGSLVLYGFLPLYASPIYGYRALVALAPAAVYLLIRGGYQWPSVRRRLRQVVLGEQRHTG